MGVQKLKKKAELNYRKGGTWKDCGGCNHFRSDLGRCSIIGLDAGRMYQVLPHYVCDRWDNSNYMRRLLGGETF